MLLMSYGADLNARTNRGQLPIDVARTEEMKQIIRDEPRRCMDHSHKRATEHDSHPTQPLQRVHGRTRGRGSGVEQGNKKPRLEEGSVTEEEGKDPCRIQRGQ